jgi:Protein of unknown function (DUF4239)
VHPTVNPVSAGIIAFACTFCGAVLGMWLQRALPPHHLDTRSKDTIRVSIGLISMITALVLGLVTASAKSSFDAADAAVEQSATNILALDRTLARYGPETDEIRRALQQALRARIDTIWPQDSSKLIDLDPMRAGTGRAAEGIAGAIHGLRPRDDSQRELRLRALELVETMLRARWLSVAAAERSVSGPFLLILVLWLTITFASFGLFAPRNATVLAVLFVCALSIGSAVFLLLELDTPFDGVFKVSAEPLRYALAHLNQ